ncbi:MAG: alkaline phosphatase D family protein [Opitutaceae bacterium]|nr:alkaline phosphatase D family protein [Opitutaceae bacterium]
MTPLRLAAALLLAVPVLALSAADYAVAPDAPAYVTHGPILGRLTATSVGVWMRTSAPAKIRVRYGTDPARLDQLSALGATERAHDNTGWVELTGLQPDTLYHYRIQAPHSPRPDEESGGTFRTLPDAETYRDARHNPRGLFNFRFEIGACSNQLRGTATTMPAFRQLLDRHAGQIAFGIQNGDWIYEERREYPAAAWLEAQGLAPADAPEVVQVAPAIAGVWENYKLYLERSANLREWHRHTPSYFLFDDHELLGDVTGTGNIGFRNRRAVFRDIGIRGWADYLGWSNPRWHDDEIVFGHGRLEAGSDILHDPSGRLAGLDPARADNLMVLWNDPNAGINEDKYDDVGGDPNAGVYAIREVLDAHRLRLAPAARATGEVAYSIGRPHYTSFRVSNCEFFLVDTRSYRQLHDSKQPFAPGVEFLGARQKAWLKERMRRSDADFLFVVSSVSVSLPHLEPRAKTAEQANENDSWSAAGAERRELLDFWQSLGKPVLLLTGDLHNAYAIRLGDRLWEFLSAPMNSNSTFSSDAGDPPPSGPFRWLDQDLDIRWSTYVPSDAAAPRYNPVYTVVQVNNVFPSPGPEAGRRHLAFPRPQVVVQFYRATTGELLYAESVAAADPAPAKR